MTSWTLEQVERLAAVAAETINGGEFKDGRWYSDGHRDAWRRAVSTVLAAVGGEVAAEVERANLERDAAIRMWRHNTANLDSLDQAHHELILRVAAMNETREELERALSVIHTELEKERVKNTALRTALAAARPLIEQNTMAMRWPPAPHSVYESCLALIAAAMSDG